MLQMEGIPATPNDTAPAAAVAVAAAAGGNTDEDLLLARCARRRRLRLRRLLNQEGGLDAPPPLPVPRNSIVLPEEAHTRKNHLAVARMPVINNNNNNNNGVVSSSTTPSPARSPSPILCSGGASHYGSVCIIGKRRDMEDAVTIAPDFVTGHDFFGVYDGHGGREVAEACKERMHVVLAGEVQKNSSFTLPDIDKDVVLAAAYWRETMEACFLKVDSEVIAGRSLLPGSAPQKTVGSTAVVAVLGTRRIVVANCGDSRAVLCRSGVAVPLSCDHKPDRPDELERVEALGGRVIDWDGYRVLGVLATSRSIGDQYLKPFVIPEPEVTVTDRTDRDEFLILASDGLWNVVSSERACALVRMCLDGRVAGGLSRRGETTAAASGDGDQPAAFAATALAELAMSRGSRDNISVVVVVL